MTDSLQSSSHGSARLQRALEVFLAGTDRDQVLRDHPDLADLLGPMFDAGTEHDDQDQPKKSSPREIGGFEILRELGRGGMGVVYEAHQPALARKVALKILPAVATVDPLAVARFRREAAAAAALEHPGIVKVYELGNSELSHSELSHSELSHWIAMELVPGLSLGERAAELRQLGIPACVATIAAVADALHCAHQKGLVHRDVKPANILLRADLSPVLTDFGLARDLLSPAASQSGFVGTPYYASPEHVDSKLVDARSDVFSLGATLYVLLTGEKPFPGDTTDEVLEKIRLEAPRDPKHLRVSLPKDLCSVLFKALEKRPQDRYQSAADFAKDLRAFLAFEPVSARRPPTWTRLSRWVRRRPLQAALFLALLALGGTGAFVLTNLDHLKAGEKLARAREIEESLIDAMGLLLFAEPERAHESAARALALDPVDEEAVVFSVLATLGTPQGKWDPIRVDNAREELVSLQPKFRDRPALRRLEHELSLILEGLPTAAPEVRPEVVSGVLESFVAGHFATERARDGEDDKKREACGMLRRAVLASPRPSLALALAYARSVHVLKQKEAASDVTLMLRTHWPERADALHAIGLVLSPHEPEAAESAYRKCLELSPRWASAWNDLAMLLVKQGRKVEAIAALKRAVELDAKRATSLESLADLCLGLEPKDVDGADRYSRAALALRPTSVPAAVSLAMAHLERQDYENAKALVEPVVLRAPDNARAHAILGEALTRTGDASAGDSHLRTAFELAPDDPLPLGFRAAAQWERGEGHALVETLKQLSKLEPKHATVHANLGVALASIGDFEAGAAEVRIALELEPRNQATRLNLVSILQQAGQHTKLREALEEWRSAAPKQARAWLESARALVSDPASNPDRDLPRAQAWLDHTIEIEPRAARSVLTVRAELLLWAGRLQEARELLENALSKLDKADGSRSELEGLLLRCKRAQRDSRSTTSRPGSTSGSTSAPKGTVHK